MKNPKIIFSLKKYHAYFSGPNLIWQFPTSLEFPWGCCAVAVGTPLNPNPHHQFQDGSLLANINAGAAQTENGG